MKKQKIIINGSTLHTLYDKKFRSQLKQDPIACLKGFGENNILTNVDLDESISVVVKTNDQDNFYFVIPANTIDTKSMQQQIQAGNDKVSTAGSVGTVSTAGSVSTISTPASLGSASSAATLTTAGSAACE